MDNTGAERAWPDDEWPATPSESAGSGSRRMLIVVVVVALVCLGGTGLALATLRDGFLSATAPIGERVNTSPKSPAAPRASVSAAPTGPRASDYPVRTTEDVGEVCDGFFYPQAPPLAGAAPHPIVVSQQMNKNSTHRYHPAYVDLPDDLPESRQKAWQPDDPATAQLVACVNLVESGRSLGDCKFDDPSPTTAPMVEGIYEVTVYEVATRREIAKTRITGAGKCPLVVLLSGDRIIHSDVTGRQLYESLHQYVEK
jgi:hypothetical protein